MNNKICPKCGTANPADMSFCTNCGQALSAGAPAGTFEEPPPTVFINPTPTAATNPVQPNVPPAVGAIPPQPPKKGGKGWLFALVGCLGLLILSGIGIAALAYLGMSSDLTGRTNNYTPSPTPNTTPANKTNSDNKNSRSDNSNQKTLDDSGSGDFLVTLLKARPTIATFDQTKAETVETDKYFPEATGAAQATYTDGSDYVYLTVGQFDSMDDAEKNFNDQMGGVKSNGGKVTYRNTAADGTISALYESKGFYFAEYCNTNNYCNRIHSDDRQALKKFVDGYASE